VQKKVIDVCYVKSMCYSPHSQPVNGVLVQFLSRCIFLFTINEKYFRSSLKLINIK
jgi:hypothetical protein